MRPSPSRVPDAGDIVWMALSPQAGREQAGHRPALVLSPSAYNGKTGMIVCCPMTSQLKGYPFEVVVTVDPPSAVLADQIKSLDWRARSAVRKARAPKAVLEEVRAKIRALIGL
jgi:mRNA interferase MazF